MIGAMIVIILFVFGLGITLNALAGLADVGGTFLKYRKAFIYEQIDAMGEDLQKSKIPDHLVWALSGGSTRLLLAILMPFSWAFIFRTWQQGDTVMMLFISAYVDDED